MTTTTKQARRSESRNAKTAREIIREAPLSPPGIGLREIRIKTKTEEEEDVGSDTAAPHPLTHPPSSAPSRKPIEDINKTSPAPTPKFLKPAGVEDPSDSVARRRDGSRLAQQQQQREEEEAGGDTSHGNGTRRLKLKRERDDHSEAGAPAAADHNKPKRKKSGAAAAA